MCFALAVTNRAVLAVYRPLLEPLGLTHPQYLVMLALWDHHRSDKNGRPLSVKEIAASLQLDSATLSPMLKRLEALGLITRTRSAADERATDVELTKAALRCGGEPSRFRLPWSSGSGSGSTNSSTCTRCSPAINARRAGRGRPRRRTNMKRASVSQYLGYVFGRRLPDEFRDWVRDDLAGPGAVRRHMIRYAIPPLLVLAPFWLLPASLYVHLEMTAPIYIWALLMALALNKVWRRHRLAQHGLDPNLVGRDQPQEERPHTTRPTSPNTGRARKRPVAVATAARSSRRRATR